MVDNSGGNKVSSEDWSQDADDADGGDWAEYMHGPIHGEDDDDEIKQSEQLQKFARNFSRTEEIVLWLSQSKYAKKFKNAEGFFVSKGPHVRLQNGSVVDLLDWLLKEGIMDGLEVLGFVTVYSRPGDKYGEKLSFFAKRL